VVQKFAQRFRRATGAEGKRLSARIRTHCPAITGSGHAPSPLAPAILTRTGSRAAVVAATGTSIVGERCQSAMVTLVAGWSATATRTVVSSASVGESDQSQTQLTSADPARW
jgi:hypothetical protein